VKLLGALYLLYLTYSHFFGHEEGQDRRTPPRARPMLGLSPFWATVVRVEVINLAFSIDSILVAVAMTPNIWVVMTGGLLGIVAMRVVVGQLLVLVQRYPPLVDGAFVIIAWVGGKLGLEYLHTAGYIGFEIPRWISLGLIVVIFLIALVYARMQGPVAPPDHEAEEVLGDGPPAGQG
jgi:YkoY family integral membrane protein